jgi:D-amino-acid dehydrogenase
MGTLGVEAPVIAERGYSVQSADHSWDEALPPTVFEEHAMVVSRFTSGLRASSFVEFGSPDAPGDPRKWRFLERRLGDLGIRFSPEPDRWVGPRPTLPDYLPAIGRLQLAFTDRTGPKRSTVLSRTNLSSCFSSSSVKPK